MKMNLFGNTIEPACIYCENGRMNKDLQTVFCKKRGTVQPYDKCRSYLYAPLKRIPKRQLPLPRYSKQDFEL